MHSKCLKIQFFPFHRKKFEQECSTEVVLPLEKRRTKKQKQNGMENEGETQKNEKVSWMNRLGGDWLKTDKQLFRGHRLQRQPKTKKGRKGKGKEGESGQPGKIGGDVTQNLHWH